MDVKEVKREHLESLASSLENLRLSNTFVDVVLICEGGEIPAHRNVLSASCSYFEAMFRSGLMEASTGQVQFDGINWTVMKVVVNFLYTGAISAKIKKDFSFLKDVLAVAHILQILSLVKYCSAVLTDYLNPANFIELWEIAERYNLNDLLIRVLSFITARFSELQTKRSFVPLSVRQMKKLVGEVLCTNQTADDLAAVALQWAKKNPDNGSKLVDLFQQVELQHLSNRCLRQLTEEPVVKESPDLLHLLLTIATSRLLRPEVPTFHFPFRIHFLQFHAENSIKIQTYYTREKAWSIVRDIPESVCSFLSICSYRSYLYFITELNNFLVQYHPDSGHTTLFDVPTDQQPGWKIVFGFENKIYFNTENTFLRFNLATSLWETLNPLQIDGSNFFFISTRDQLFLCNDRSNTIQRYDVETDSWHLVTRNAEVRNRNCAVAGGKLYFYKNAVFHVYNPIANSWEQSGVQEAEGKCMVFMHYEMPFLIFYQESNCNCLWQYDPTSGSWEQLTKLLQQSRCWNKCLVTVE